MTYLQLIDISSMTYTLVILSTKASILLLFLRVFSPSRPVRISIHVALWANIGFYVPGFFMQLFWCVPRDAIWNLRMRQNARCLDAFGAQLASAAINVLSDLTILILPISTVWTLQMPGRKKLGILAVFATGSL